MFLYYSFFINIFAYINTQILKIILNIIFQLLNIITKNNLTSIILINNNITIQIKLKSKIILTYKNHYNINSNFKKIYIKIQK